MVEVSYDELVKDPIATVERIYDSLGWSFTDRYRARLEQELGLSVQPTVAETATPAARFLDSRTAAPSIPTRPPSFQNATTPHYPH